LAVGTSNLVLSRAGFDKLIKISSDITDNKTNIVSFMESNPVDLVVRNDDSPSSVCDGLLDIASMHSCYTKCSVAVRRQLLAPVGEQTIAAQILMKASNSKSEQDGRC
jgi:hypothetical protein